MLNKLDKLLQLLHRKIILRKKLLLKLQNKLKLVKRLSFHHLLQSQLVQLRMKMF